MENIFEKLEPFLHFSWDFFQSTKPPFFLYLIENLHKNISQNICSLIKEGCSRAIKRRVFSLGSKGGDPSSSHLHHLSHEPAIFTNLKFVEKVIPRDLMKQFLLWEDILFTNRGDETRLNCYPFGFWLWSFPSSFYGRDQENNNRNYFHLDSLWNLEKEQLYWFHLLEKLPYWNGFQVPTQRTAI